MVEPHMMNNVPTPPPVYNFLKIYTELATADKKDILILEEFASLGPKTTVAEINRMWIQLNLHYEWTIVVIDPLDFTDSLTAKSRDTMKRNHHGNYKSWSEEKTEKFYQAIEHTGNTLLVLEGVRKSLPLFHKAFDRVVMVKQPEHVTLGPGTG